MTIIALQAEEYAKKELLAQEEAVKAMTSGEKMDLEALAELVASKLRGSASDMHLYSQTSREGLESMQFDG